MKYYRVANPDAEVATLCCSDASQQAHSCAWGLLGWVYFSYEKSPPKQVRGHLPEELFNPSCGTAQCWVLGRSTFPFWHASRSWPSPFMRACKAVNSSGALLMQSVKVLERGALGFRGLWAGATFHNIKPLQGILVCWTEAHMWIWCTQRPNYLMHCFQTCFTSPIGPFPCLSVLGGWNFLVHAGSR